VMAVEVFGVYFMIWRSLNQNLSYVTLDLNYEI
jgi:hypothetical protein